MYSSLLRNLSTNLLKVKPFHSNSILREVKLTCYCARPSIRLQHNVKPSKSVKGINLKPKVNVTDIHKVSRSDVYRLFRLAKPERFKIYGAVIFLVISSGISNLVPLFFGKLIDVISTAAEDGSLITNLQNISLVLVGVFIVGGLANFCRSYLFTISGQNIIKKLRETVFNSIMIQEMSFFDKNKTGELINRLSADSSIVGRAVTSNISDGLRAVVQGVMGISLMSYISIKLTMISVAIVPPVVIVAIIYGRYIKRITQQVQNSLADSTQVAEERISSIRTVRAFAHEEKEMKAYNEKIEDILNLQKKEALASALFYGFTGLSGNCIILSVIYNGGKMMSESELSIGGLTSFLVYAVYIGISISSLTSFYTEIMRGIGASSRLFELSERKPLIPITGGLIPASPVEGNIVFNNIQFVYPTRPDVTIFNKLNLTVPSGSITAVVGASGSGKSSLGHLLLRFYDPQHGKVYLDNENICDLNPTWLRQNIGTVSQEPVLFSCSIADNIKYGASDINNINNDEVINAARQANAYQFIQDFPEQFNTMVGERGQMLSGGQRQRIAIARAILKNPKILLLDEATSALDAESEYLVQEALERLMVNRTVITIAHRLSTIKTANQIAVLDNGQIAEVGSYYDLMQIEGGLFRKLVERQTITS